MGHVEPFGHVEVGDAIFEKIFCNSFRVWKFLTKNSWSFDLKPQPVTWCVGQVLLDPKVSLGGLDTGMAQTQLNLIEPCLAFVGQFCERPAQVTWREDVYAGLDSLLPFSHP